MPQDVSDFLQQAFTDRLENMPMGVINRIYFQQDTAPPHNAAIVIQLFRREFNDRLIATKAQSSSPQLIF